MTWTLVMCGAALAADLRVGTGERFATIGAAVDAASDGDVVLVGPGHYAENIDVRVDVTIRATSGPAQTTYTGATYGGNRDANLIGYADVVLEGFTVTAEGRPRHCLRFYEGSLVLRDSVVTDCRAGDGLGGGIRIEPDVPATIERVAFRDNVALAQDGVTGRGAHVWFRGSTLTILDSTFERGHADGDGGGIMALDGEVRIERSVFVDHSAGDDGGTLAIDGVPNTDPFGVESNGVRRLVLRDNVFRTSTAGNLGGILWMRLVAQHEIVRNELCGGSAPGRGGGVHAIDVGRGPIANNVFLGNTSGDDGGALFVDVGTPVLENNDLLANTAADHGGAIGLLDATVELRSNLFAWNEGVDVAWLQRTPATTLDWSAWFGGSGALLGGQDPDPSPGAGDVRGDPLLPGLTRDGVCGNDDLRRAAGTPLADAGDPALQDPDGSRSDIGAYGGPRATRCPADSPGVSGECPGDPGDTGAPPTGHTGAPTGHTGVAVGETAAPTGDTGDPVGPPDDEEQDGGGCGCATPTAPGGALVLLVALVLRRRVHHPVSG